MNIELIQLLCCFANRGGWGLNTTPDSYRNNRMPRVLRNLGNGSDNRTEGLGIKSRLYPGLFQNRGVVCFRYYLRNMHLLLFSVVTSVAIVAVMATYSDITRVFDAAHVRPSRILI